LKAVNSNMTIEVFCNLVLPFTSHYKRSASAAVLLTTKSKHMPGPVGGICDCYGVLCLGEPGINLILHVTFVITSRNRMRFRLTEGATVLWFLKFHASVM